MKTAPTLEITITAGTMATEMFINRKALTLRVLQKNEINVHVFESCRQATSLDKLNL